MWYESNFNLVCDSNLSLDIDQSASPLARTAELWLSRKYFLQLIHVWKFDSMFIKWNAQPLFMIVEARRFR